MCKSKSFEQYANTQIAVYTAMLNFIPTIKEVARKFNGKVMNARFTAALEAASPVTHIGGPRYIEKDVPCFHCNFTQRYDGTKDLEIKLWYLDGYDVDRNEISNTFYNIEDCNNKIYGGPLNADELCSRLDNCAEYIRGNIQGLRDKMQKLDGVIDEYLAIYRRLAELREYGYAIQSHVKEHELQDAVTIAKVPAYRF